MKFLYFFLFAAVCISPFVVLIMLLGDFQAHSLSYLIFQFFRNTIAISLISAFIWSRKRMNITEDGVQFQDLSGKLIIPFSNIKIAETKRNILDKAFNRSSLTVVLKEPILRRRAMIVYGLSISEADSLQRAVSSRIA